MSKSSAQSSSSRGRLDKTRGTRKTARCPAAGSLKSALSKAVFIICSEFRLQGDLPVPIGEDCHQLRQWWDNWAASVQKSKVLKKQARQKKLESTFKGSKRIFDFPCEPCDKKAATASRAAWQKHVGTPARMPAVSWCHDPLWLLQQRVRELCTGWGSNLKKTRKDLDPLSHVSFSERLTGVYVPDQQGCLEAKRLIGGTLSVRPDACSSDDSLVRVGIAKTKGKFRTVTMQSARVKRVLKPVHAALYDHLSSFGWLVRGNVTRQDYDAVINDVRPGEKIISGDYTAATDNIYLEAVEAIVDVLAECPELTEEERKVLVGSFKNLRWESQQGTQHPILRGSMMGNLVSFPLLCLLNKACFDICTDVFFGSGTRRIGRFNGDDCLFPGNTDFFRFWRTVTGTYGLIVNEDKTGISDHWADLNSQPARKGSKGLNPKPVLSFLRPYRQEPDGLLREVIEGIRYFSRNTQAWILNVAMRHEISLREICVVDVPERTRRFLFKKSWFRRALSLGPAKILEEGTKRTPDVTLGNPPLPGLLDLVSYEHDVSLRKHVDAWTGVSFQGYPNPHCDNCQFLYKKNGSSCATCTWWFTNPVTGHTDDGSRVIDWVRRKPYTSRIDRQEYYARTKGIPTDPPRWVIKCRTKWQFLWPTSLYKRFERRGWLMTDQQCESEWMEDHFLLTIKTEFYNSVPTLHHPLSKGLFVPPNQCFGLPHGGVRLPRGYGRVERIVKPRFHPKTLGDFGRHLGRLLALFRQDR
nr:MAG: putative RNA-dependent RNA polymerase [Sanya botourmia-like virus 6]